MAYAEGTTVSIEKSMADIRTLLAKHGCDSFGRWDTPGKIVVVFLLDGESYRMTLAPDMDPARRAKYRAEATGGRRIFTDEQWAEKELPRLARSMLLYLKAQFVAVEDGLLTRREALLPSLLVAGNRTVGEIAKELPASGLGRLALPGGSE